MEGDVADDVMLDLGEMYMKELYLKSAGENEITVPGGEQGGKKESEQGGKKESEPEEGDSFKYYVLGWYIYKFILDK